MNASRTLVQQRFFDTTISVLHPSKPIVAHPTTSVYDAIQLLKSHNIGALVVIDADHHTIGMFSEQDVIRRVALEKFDHRATALESVMTTQPMTMYEQTGLARAISDMVHYNIRHLPIERNNTLIGIISIRDIVSYVYTQMTKKIVEGDFAEVYNESAVDAFLTNTIDAELSPYPAICVTNSDTITTAISRMSGEAVGSVTVVNAKGKTVGIFTERDYLQRVANENIDITTTTIETVMTANPETLLGTASIAMAFKLMAEGKFRHLPIVDQEEKVIGVLSVRIFMRRLAERIVDEIRDTKKKNPS